MATTATKKMVFDWEGRDAKGNKLSGTMEAPNADWVKATLRRQGTRPVQVRKQRESLFSGGKSKIKPTDIAIFSRQLATMMNAGVPLVQSLEMVAGGLENPGMRKLVHNIRTEIEGGSNLSNALRQHPQQFDALFCNLVAAGEQSGTLDQLLNELATYKEKTEALKAKIRKAMVYPCAILIVAFIVTCILLIFVVPQFEALFAGFGADLPAFTQLVVGLSEFMQEWYLVIFGGVGGVFFGFAQAKKRSKKFANTLDALSLKLPIVGDILRKGAIARFARTLATMSNAGVPLVEAMESVAGATGNVVYERGILRMRDSAASGQQLQSTMHDTGLFPSLVVQMTAIGEQSGALDAMLGKVADFYETEVDNAVDNLTALMEPVIMAFLGVVIGGLVIAMYLPIFKMGGAM
ncbi:MAG: type II secretion system F family protein [Halofilum sp. (in: g-proteobacteria)]